MAAGGDLVNFVKQYNQAGMKDKAELAVGLMFITDIHSLGVDQFEGTQFTDAWYWNFDEKNKAWADKFKEKANTRPSFAHAANYSAALNYLEAVQEAGTDASDDVVAKLEGKKIDDVFLRDGEVRAADHRVTARRLPREGEVQGPGQGGVGLRGGRQHHPGPGGLRPGLARLQDVT